MDRIFYEHPAAIALIPGAVGEPGEREFFIQVVSADFLTTLACDKFHLTALADKCQELIDQLYKSHEISVDLLRGYISPEIPPLTFPLEEDFQIGIMGIAYSPIEKKIIFEVQAFDDQTETHFYSEEELILMESAPDGLKAKLDLLAIRKFILHSKKLVDQGRKPCPFCGLPIDRSGHLCPRANGYRR
jgi:uncharacterized repeat protein (TIGR03847 family)